LFLSYIVTVVFDLLKKHFEDGDYTGYENNKKKN